MRFFQVFAVICLVLLCSVSTAGALTLERSATLGKPNTEEEAGQKGKERVTQIWWLSEELILIAGHDIKKDFVRCIRSDSGKVVWDKTIVGSDSRFSLSGDKAVLVLQVKRSFLDGDDAKKDGPPVKAEDQVAVEMYDVETGDLIREVKSKELFRPAKRDLDVTYLDEVRAGATKDELLVVFNHSMQDELRYKRAEKDEDADVAEGFSFGYRAYLIDLKRKKVRARYKMDPYQWDIDLAVKGRYLGYVTTGLFCVYDVKRRRDHLIFGHHKDWPAKLDFVIDAPFFSNIRVGEKVTVVTKDQDMQGGPLIVIDMEKGNILSNTPALLGHVEVDVDFERERIVMTGSSKTLAVYDYSGKVLAKIEDASKMRNLAIAFSPGGDKIAVGGLLGVVEVYTVKE